MADFMTIGGVADINTQAKTSLNKILGVEQFNLSELLQQTIDLLGDKILELQKQEKEFLSQFEDCPDIATFKAKIAQYYSEAGLNNFTGTNLAVIVSNYKKVLKQKQKQKEQELETILFNLLHSDFIKDLNPQIRDIFLSSGITDQMARQAGALLIGELSRHSPGTLQSTEFAKNDNGVLTLCANLTTAAFNKALTNLKNTAHLRKNKSNAKEVDRARILLKSTQESKKMTNLNLTQTFGVQYGILSQADKNDFDPSLLSEEELTQANTEITELIVSKITGSAREFARQRITQMWHQHRTMFFIGDSPAQLEGILGEISSYIALSHLLGEKNMNRLQWAAKDLSSSGGQLSLDFVLQKMNKSGHSFGIQIKNTMSNIKDNTVHSISFVDKQLDTVFSDLELNTPEFTSLKDAYISDAFNVPYQLNGDTFVEVDSSYDTDDRQFKRFISVKEALETTINNINLYLTRFTTDLLFMGAEGSFKSSLASLNDSVRGIGGNFIYIAGSRVTFASEILSELQMELALLRGLKNKEEQASLRLSTYFDGIKDGDKTISYNIVAVKNGQATGLSDHALKAQSAWTAW